MKFNQYLNENTLSGDLRLLDKHCKPFINDWKKLNIKEFLYSGRDSSLTDFEKKTVRKNRKPLTTELDIHNLIDNWFYKKFGIKARSNSVFCTFNWKIASKYGRVYMIFPIGNYTAISSKYIDDLYEIWFDYITNVLGIDEYIYRKNKELYNENAYNFIINYLDTSTYSNKLIYHNNEIMINCKNYYMVDGILKDKLINHFKGK